MLWMIGIVIETIQEKQSNDNTYYYTVTYIVENTLGALQDL